MLAPSGYTGNNTHGSAIVSHRRWLFRSSGMASRPSKEQPGGRVDLDVPAEPGTSSSHCAASSTWTRNDEKALIQLRCALAYEPTVSLEALGKYHQWWTSGRDESDAGELLGSIGHVQRSGVRDDPTPLDVTGGRYEKDAYQNVCHSSEGT